MSVSFYPLNNAASAGAGTDRTGQNWSFEQYLSTWTPDSLSWQVWVPSAPAEQAFVYHGAAYACFDSFVARVTSGVLDNDDTFATTSGAVWTSTCRVVPQSGYNGEMWGRIGLKFLDAANVVLQTSPGNKIATPNGNAGLRTAWQVSTVTATAPPSTAKVKLYVEAKNTDTFYTGRVCFDWCTLHG